jgi:hypothetical protein
LLASLIRQLNDDDDDDDAVPDFYFNPRFECLQSHPINAAFASPKLSITSCT